MRMIKPLARLHEQLRKLPGIGSKSALRLSYHVLDMKRSDVEALAAALVAVKDQVHLCTSCFNLCEGTRCEICEDEKRDHGLICVVEEPQDVAAMERTKGFEGVYHVLHGVLSPLDGVGPDQLKIRELMRRLQDGSVHEVQPIPMWRGRQQQPIWRVSSVPWASRSAALPTASPWVGTLNMPMN